MKLSVPFFGGNWKMHHGPSAAGSFFDRFLDLFDPHEDRTVVFFPPAISGFIVAIVGIQLGLVAIDHVLDIDDFKKPDYSRHVLFLSPGSRPPCGRSA